MKVNEELERLLPDKLKTNFEKNENDNYYQNDKQLSTKYEIRRIVNETVTSPNVIFDHASARWLLDKRGSNIGIQNVDLKVEPGKLCTVVGPVGSGKTTLLNVLLGELELDEGKVSINGTLSYASQEPWLFEGSIKQNILFVEPYDEKK